MAPLKAPWPRNFRPNPNNFGDLFNTLAAAIGTGGFPVAGTATNLVYVGVPAARRFMVYNASMQGPTAFSGASAITAQLIRANNQGTPTAVTLTAATSITATIIAGADNNVEWTITPASNGANVLLPGDTLYWKIICLGDITQGQLTGVVEAAIIK